MIDRSQAIEEGWFVPNDTGMCLCGCGSSVGTYARTKRGEGAVRGEFKKFVDKHQYRRSGSSHPAWLGGRAKTSEGYIRTWRPEHPYSDGRYVLEHRLVLENHLGRYLEPHENVHHKNGVRDDNRLDNLELRILPHGTGATHCKSCGGSFTPVVYSEGWLNE